MKNTYAIPLFIIFLFFVAAPDLMAGDLVNPSPNIHKIILTHARDGISPDAIRIEKGDTIVWINQDEEPVVIRFLPEVGIVCSPIINFYADLSGFYKTGPIRQGGTAGLCFISSGEYTYEVRRLVRKGTGKPTEQVLQGKVFVKGVMTQD